LPKDKSKPVCPKYPSGHTGHLDEALKAVAQTFAVVTLAVCRGGADVNPIRLGSSLAHRLHELGIPVVVGSQFPLTFSGSAIFHSTST
jgi:hypothetical protein